MVSAVRDRGAWILTDMFKAKKKSHPKLSDADRQLVTAYVHTHQFFSGAALPEGERLEEMAARQIGVTLEAFRETLRYLRSLADGRVIPRE
jgi:hypothetical protein